MSDIDQLAAPRSRPSQLNWRLVSLAIVVAGLALVAGANAHLVYVAVVSQPECVAGASADGGVVKYQAAKRAC